MIDGYRFHLRFPVKWGEMDALGHVNNTSYFRFLEEARVAYCDRIGLRPDLRAAIGPLLVTCKCDFFRPIVWPCELVTATRVTRVGNTSFTCQTAIATADDLAHPCAVGESVLVTVRYGSNEKIRVPDDVRARIEQLDSA